MSVSTDVVLVVGDVNSTMAASIVAKKLNVKLVHVEGGLRSGDMTMPEEVNRRITDSITDYFFTTSHFADKHLSKEGVKDSQIFRVGNTMIDSLVNSLKKIQRPPFLDEFGDAEYFLLTLHRPSNVDDQSYLKSLLRIINSEVGERRVVFPIHPRTQNTLGDTIDLDRFYFCEPQNYLRFLYLLKGAKAVITDSGGIQEETTYLGVPCLTLRPNTERPETISIGTNVLIGDDFELLSSSIKDIVHNRFKKGMIPELWDGNTSSRIVKTMVDLFH